MSARTWLVVAAGLLPAVAVANAAGCGSDVVVIPASPDAGSGGSGGYVFIDAGTGGHEPDGTAPADALPDYVDPGCPDAPAPIESFACDPYNQNNGDCAPGEACYIYVSYPTEPCGQEEYGAFCSPAGPGGQGDPCSGGFDCGIGMVCVVTGSGTQCVALCNLSGNDGCPPGLVCEPIDVKGFGGCL